MLQLSLSSKTPNHSLDYINQADDIEVNKTNKDKQHTQIIKKIYLITTGQKQYIKRILNDIFNNSTKNAENIWIL